jgi:hypothetical protein
MTNQDSEWQEFKRFAWRVAAVATFVGVVAVGLLVWAS